MIGEFSQVFTVGARRSRRPFASVNTVKWKVFTQAPIKGDLVHLSVSISNVVICQF